ncbi:hypothetical protein SAMN05192584_12067 [Streptomyces pini]|uniref:Uncharacterized protein n=1 Tax=Streptomyces pini TaxID=1520580 RepID=A0A1I4IBI8_9ACTN|nr:hypothetical protein SAMN05192584_12067 [Streptomyces pini]
MTLACTGTALGAHTEAARRSRARRACFPSPASVGGVPYDGGIAPGG